MDDLEIEARSCYCFDDLKDVVVKIAESVDSIDLYCVILDKKLDSLIKSIKKEILK